MIALVPHSPSGKPTLVTLANLDEAGRGAVALLIATLCDDAMRAERDRFMAGELALTIDDGEASLIPRNSTP